MSSFGLLNILHNNLKNNVDFIIIFKSTRWYRENLNSPAKQWKIAYLQVSSLLYCVYTNTYTHSCIHGKFYFWKSIFLSREGDQCTIRCVYCTVTNLFSPCWQHSVNTKGLESFTFLVMLVKTELFFGQFHLSILWTRDFG